MEHPLWIAIKTRDRAIKKKAHPIVIDRLEKRVESEVRAMRARLKTDDVKFLLDQIAKGIK
jgi:hypothetical protein